MGCTTSNNASLAQQTATDAHVGRKHRFQSFDSKVKSVWDKADANMDGKLSFDEVKKLIRALNGNIPTRVLKKSFEEHDKDGSGELDYSEFKNMFDAVESLPPLDDVFVSASGQKEFMLADDLRRFLESSSNGLDNRTEFDCAKLILEYEGARAEDIGNVQETASFDEEPKLSKKGFFRLMSNGNHNMIGNPAMVSNVYQDMTQPLSHYFVSSSHNSYLSGNQLSSASSADTLGRTLRLGVRVVELDCWDGNNGEPIVNHGHTLCKPIAFEECLVAIKENAFKVSEYPVIVTIENHCSLPFQQRQAELLQSVLGDLLFHWDGEPESEGGEVDWALGPKTWLSPADLKMKVVVRDKPKKKVKNASKTGKSIRGLVSLSSSKAKLPAHEASASGQTAATSAADAPGAATESPPPVDGESSEPTAVDEMDVEIQHFRTVDRVEVEEDDDEEGSTDISGIAPELLRVMYIKNIKLKYNHEKEKQAIDYMFPAFSSSSSIVEKKMGKLCKPGYHCAAICHYAQTHLIRVYPSGGRVDSSNYDPMMAWVAGCQIVALNYQTFGTPVFTNQAKFANNGGCGYVLKPERMRNPQGSWDGTVADKGQTYTVDIEIISGHYLPKPNGSGDKGEVIDPYVKIKVNGIAEDCKKVETAVVKNNGFNPVWKEQMSFNLQAVDLATFVFQVYDQDKIKDDFIGYYGVAAQALRPGFRMIPLKAANGAPLDNAYLFAHVSWSPTYSFDLTSI